MSRERRVCICPFVRDLCFKRGCEWYLESKDACAITEIATAIVRIAKCLDEALAIRRREVKK